MTVSDQINAFIEKEGNGNVRDALNVALFRLEQSVPIYVVVFKHGEYDAEQTWTEHVGTDLGKARFAIQASTKKCNWAYIEKWVNGIKVEEEEYQERTCLKQRF